MKTKKKEVEILIKPPIINCSTCANKSTCTENDKKKCIKDII